LFLWFSLISYEVIEFYRNYYWKLLSCWRHSSGAPGMWQQSYNHLMPSSFVSICQQICGLN